MDANVRLAILQFATTWTKDKKECADVLDLIKICREMEEYVGGATLARVQLQGVTPMRPQ